MWRRLPRLLSGFVVMATGVAMVVHAELGAGPWDVLHQGVDLRTPLSFGTAVIVVGFVVFLGWIPLRQRPGVGTLLNVLVVGLFADAALWLLPTPEALAARVAFLLAGTVLLGIGAGTYIAAGLGTGPRDGIMMGLAARGIPVRWVRTGMELTALTVGWLLGGTVGVGTLVAGLGVGHVIQPTLRFYERRDAVARRQPGELVPAPVRA